MFFIVSELQGVIDIGGWKKLWTISLTADRLNTKYKTAKVCDIFYNKDYLVLILIHLII